MSQRCEEMLHPVIPVSPAPEGACRGAAACTAALAEAAGQGPVTVVLECYPGGKPGRGAGPGAAAGL